MIASPTEGDIVSTADTARRSDFSAKRLGHHHRGDGPNRSPRPYTITAMAVTGVITEPHEKTTPCWPGVRRAVSSNRG